MSTFLILEDPDELIINNIHINLLQLTQKNILLTDYFKTGHYHFHEFSILTVDNIIHNTSTLIKNNKLLNFTNINYLYISSSTSINFISLNRYFSPQIILKNCQLHYTKYSSSNKNFSSNKFDIVINIKCNPNLCPLPAFNNLSQLNNNFGSLNMQTSKKIQNAKYIRGSRKTSFIRISSVQEIIISPEIFPWNYQSIRELLLNPDINTINNKLNDTLIPLSDPFIGKNIVSNSMDSLFADFNKDGININLSFWNVDNINNMANMFKNTSNNNPNFNPVIDDWIVNNVTNMQRMFERSTFNGNIRNWNVSKVINMEYMFANSAFNQDISNWDVSNVTNMVLMFYYAINYRNANNNIQIPGENIQILGIEHWNKNIYHKSGSEIIVDFMFYDTSINLQLAVNNPDSSYILPPLWYYKFYGDHLKELNYLGNLNNIAESNNYYVMHDTYKKLDTSFNDILVTDVSNFNSWFANSHFNEPLDKWANQFIQQSINMKGMFYGSPFDKDISIWDVSNVTNMKYMFSQSYFNQPLDNWNVSKVINMEYMFAASYFNKDISNWDVRNVTNMRLMFYYAGNFNQDISNWQIQNLFRDNSNNYEDIFTGTPIVTLPSNPINDNIFNGWYTTIFDAQPQIFSSNPEIETALISTGLRKP